MVVSHGLTVIEGYPVVGFRLGNLADHLVFRICLIDLAKLAVLTESVQLTFRRAAQRQDLFAELADIGDAAVVNIHGAQIRSAIFIIDDIELLISIVVGHVADLAVQIPDLALRPDAALRRVDAQLLEGVGRDHMTVDVLCRINAVDRCNILCIRSVLLISLHHAGLQV